MNTATELVKLDTPQVVELRVNSSSLLAEAEALVIDSDEMYEIGAESTKVIKALAKKVEEQRTSITKPLNEALKSTNAHFKQFSDVLESAEKTLKTKLVTYVTEQDRKRREEEQRLLREAEEQRRAEQARLEAERQAAIAAVAEKIEAGDIAAAEELAQKVEDVEFEAASVAMAPVEVAAPTIAAPKASGVAMVDNWTFEVTDLAALVKAAAERPELVSLLAPNETAIRQMAKALKSAANIPGVRIYNNKTARVGR